MTRRVLHSLLLSVLIFSLSTACPLQAVTFTSSSAFAEVDPYTTGTQAMNELRWADAVNSFDQVISAKGKKVDAALYWKAYSLNKLGSTDSALSTCDELRSRYASSRWNKDCSALAIGPQVKVNNVVPSAPPAPSSRHDERGDASSAAPRGSDEDLKILALNSLLHQDPARAIPLLRDILSGGQSINVKKHALFILAQSKTPEAQSILHDAVVGKLDPELQRQAIQSMAVFQGKSGNDTLVEVYRTSSDPRVKKSVINALFITQDAARMVDLARNEKDLEIKRSIVSQLAIMNDKIATDYMMELLK